MKKKACLRVVFVALVLALAVPYQGSGETPETLARAIAAALSGWLPEQLKERGVPGAAAVVVDRNGAVWEQAWGVVDGPGSSSITPDTVFNIRSVSKNVTALGVLMAVQDGLVELDVPIAEYLPEFTVHSRFDEHPEDRITLRTMLAHRAGFTHDPPAGLDTERSGYFERYIETIPDTWLRFPVGYRHEYANRGYDLAGYILQVRSGLSFAEYIKQKVLDPIGMTRSSFDLERIEQTEDRAVGHDGGGNVVPVPFPEIPSGGLYSSIRDMSMYVQFHLKGGVVNGNRLLREDLMEQLHSIQMPRERPEDRLHARPVA